MPDLVTHLVVGHLVRRPFEWRGVISGSRPARVLFFTGTVLPDGTSRAINLLFPQSMKWTLALHTPIGAVVFIALMTCLFQPALRKQAFFNLAAGAGLHFVLDTFQKTSTSVFFWLFPFSWQDCGIPLVDAADFLPFIPLGVGLALFIEWIHARRAKQSMGNRLSPSKRDLKNGMRSPLA